MAVVRDTAPASVRPTAPPATRGALRVARGGVVAAVVLGLSLGGHVAAGGAAPSAVVGVLAVLTAAACVALSGRRWSVPRLVAVLAVGEVLLHLSLTWADSLAVPAAPMAAAAPMTPAADVMPGMADGGLDAGMLLGHAAALALAVVFLRFGEGRLWRLLAASLAPWCRDLRLAPSRPTCAPAPVPLPTRPAMVRTRLFADVLPRRGPPHPAV